MKKRTDNEITKCCAYCEKATLLPGDDYVLCAKKGVVSPSHVCRRFEYDPMKRIPKRTPDIPTLDDISDMLPDI